MSDALNNINLDALTKTALGGADTSWVQPTVAKLQTIEKKKEAEQDPVREQIKTDYAKDRKDVDTKYAGIEPVDLPKWDAAKEKAKRSTDPIEAFGSFGSVFAIAASAFTHTPIINALNGSAAAMQAIKNRDEESYNQAYDAWKENIHVALDRHNMQHQDYQDAFDKMKNNMAEGQAMLTATAAKYGDQASTLMHEAGLYEHLGGLQESRANAARGLLTVLPDLQRKNLEVQSTFALTNAQKELNEAQQSGDPSKIIEKQLAFTEAQQQIKNVFSRPNPYSSITTGVKNTISDLQLQAIDEAQNAKAKELGRPLTAMEKLAATNEVMNSSKTPSGSAQTQILTDWRRDYLATNGKPPSGAEEQAFMASSKYKDDVKAFGNDLKLKTIQEKIAEKTAQLGRPPNSTETLAIYNDVQNSGKAAGSVQTQLLNDFKRDFADMYGKPPTAQEEVEFQKQIKAVKPDLEPETLSEMADQYLAGDGTVFQNVGRGTQGSANIAALRNTIASRMEEQGITPEDQAFQMQAFKALGATLRTVGTTQGKIALGRKELDVLIPQALQASHELPRSNYPTANAVQQAVDAGVGDPRVRKLAIALQAVKSAYSQVLVRGGASTDAARAQTDDLFQNKDPEAVIQTAMDQIRAESDAVARAPGAVMDEERGTFGRKKPAPAGAAPTDKSPNSHLWGD
jgi:hypothetical protein